MKLGTIVVVHDQNNPSNGTFYHPAIVNRVWGDGDTPTVNVTVFPDCGVPYSLTSIQHFSITGYGHTCYRFVEEE